MTADAWTPALSWRVPDLLIRTQPAALPDQTEMLPRQPCIATLASSANLLMPAVSSTLLAAVNAPQPGISISAALDMWTWSHEPRFFRLTIGRERKRPFACSLSGRLSALPTRHGDPSVSVVASEVDDVRLHAGSDA